MVHTAKLALKIALLIIWQLGIASLCLLSLTACSSPDLLQPHSSYRADRQLEIQVVCHQWHTGIAFRRSDLSQPFWPELPEFSAIEYLEIGWGDLEYYTSPKPGPMQAVSALLWPTPGVLHVVGLQQSADLAFSDSEVISLNLSGESFDRLINRIAASFSRNPDGSVVPLGPGLYGSSHFYASAERYHLFRTCNSWTGEILRTGGFPLNPTLFADGLAKQLRQIKKHNKP